MAENDNINLEITEAIVEAVSPTATVSKVGDTATITVTDKNGTTTASVKDGDKGDKGDQGDKGDKGDKGDTGNTGATGATPELSIGTVSTLGPGEPATATITGTDEQPVLSLGIPKGAKGDTGDTGAAAGFGTVSASVDANIGTPAVSVTASGPNTAKNIAFAFSNLKGAKGDTGATGNGIASIEETATSGAVHTYTITYTNGNTTTFDVTDGEVTNASLAEVLEDYAKTDGAYEQMTVGNAEQLISSVTVNDKVPYNFRTSGGSIDIGNREVDKLVGGTVAWNQMIKNGNFADGTTYWRFYGVSGSVSDGQLNLEVITAGSHSIYQTLNEKPIAGHKFFMTIDVYGEDEGKTLSIRFGSNQTLISPSVINGWRHIESVKTITGTPDNKNLYIYTTNIDGWKCSIKNIQIIDLTQMFGTTIADYIYSLETANAGAGVAWFKKLFPKDYYAYNAGELMSVKTSAHEMVGFNALKTFKGYNNNSSPTFNLDNAVRVINGMSYEFNHGAVTNATSWRHAVACYDFNGNKIEKSGLLTVGDGGLGWNSSGGYYVNGTNGTRMSDTFTINFNGYIIPFFLLGDTSASTTMADPCVHLRWDGERDGDYEAYKKWTYPLDSDLELRGIPKLDSANNLYYDGDEYESDGTVTRRYAVKNLGDLTYTYNTDGTYPYMRAYISDAKTGVNNVAGNLISSVGVTVKAADIRNNGVQGIAIDDQKLVRIITANMGTDPTAFKSAMSGVYLVYELATPTTEEADPYQNPQIVDDFGTEEYVDERTVAIPVGHDTEYMNNLKAKLEMAPDSPDGDGDYIVRQTNGENSYVPLMKELPSAPSEDGTYTLKCTVASGVATLGWESEE